MICTLRCLLSLNVNHFLCVLAQFMQLLNYLEIISRIYDQFCQSFRNVLCILIRNVNSLGDWMYFWLKHILNVVKLRRFLNNFFVFDVYTWSQGPVLHPFIFMSDVSSQTTKQYDFSRFFQDICSWYYGVYIV